MEKIETSVAIELGAAQLFLDDSRLQRTEGIDREWHGLRKHPANPLVVPSPPESMIFLLGTVIREPDPLTGGDPVFRMWYFTTGDRGGTDRPWFGYAESRDGIEWRKPELGLYEIGGSAQNNAVSFGGVFSRIGLGGVVRDPGISVPDGERYKAMFSGKQIDTREKRYYLIVSPDGIHWQVKSSFVPDKPSYPDRSCFVHDPYGDEYRLYSRTKYRTDALVKKGGEAYFGRAITLLTSSDLQRWSDPELVMHAEDDDPPGTEIYGAALFPYAGMWLALPQIHCSLTDRAYIEISVAHSEDGRVWNRQKDIVLPCGVTGEWDRFNQCVSTRPVRVGDELWVYYSGRTYRHGEYKLSGLKDTGPFHSAIGLATIRLDGWCSLSATFAGGRITTVPLELPVDSRKLFINAKADWGKIGVELLDVDGGVIDRSEPVAADGVRLEARWRKNGWKSRRGDDRYQLRFTLENARIYSWSVE